MRLRPVILLVLALPAGAQDVPGVPSALFGVELDGIYEYAPEGAGQSPAGAFPVKRLLSEQRSLHLGMSLYFEPLNVDAAYPFREIDQQYSEVPVSNYRLFVYPVLPEGRLRSLDDLPEQPLPQKVIMIEWNSGDAELADGEAYRWAFDLCSSLEAELGLKPEVTDRAESGAYRCVFASDDRELEVTSAVGKTIQLSLDDDIEVQMQGDIYRRTWALQREMRRASANAARPR